MLAATTTFRESTPLSMGIRTRASASSRTGGVKPLPSAPSNRTIRAVAGVAAAIAQRILKNPLGQIFAYDYVVTGTWSDPKVEKILPPPISDPGLAARGTVRIPR